VKAYEKVEENLHSSLILAFDCDIRFKLRPLYLSGNIQTGCMVDTRAGLGVLEKGLLSFPVFQLA
jgi:hypothetical protein